MSSPSHISKSNKKRPITMNFTLFTVRLLVQGQFSPNLALRITLLPEIRFFRMLNLFRVKTS